MPDFHFGLNDDLYTRATKRFENELTLWNANENCHLLFIGTFATTKAVIDKPTAERRSFVLGLGYNPAFFCHRTRYNTDPLPLFPDNDGRLRHQALRATGPLYPFHEVEFFCRPSAVEQEQRMFEEISQAFLDWISYWQPFRRKEMLGLSFSSTPLSGDCR